MRSSLFRSCVAGRVASFALSTALFVVPRAVAVAAVAPEESVVARLETSEVAVGDTARVVVDVAGEGAVDPELLDLPVVPGLSLEVESGPTIEVGRDGALVARFVLLVRALVPGIAEIPAIRVRVRSDAVLETGSLRIEVIERDPRAIEFSVIPSVASAYANEPFDVMFRIERPSDAPPTMSRTLRLPWWNRVFFLDGRAELEPQHEVYDVEDRGLRVLFSPVAAGPERAVLSAKVALLAPEAGRIDLSGSILRFDARPTKPFSEPVDGGPRVEVAARPSSIEILPWPDGAPPEFVDAVGDFRLGAEVDRDRAGVGDLIRFTIQVRAAPGRRTNLKSANFCGPLTIDGFRVYSRRDDRLVDSLTMHLELAATRGGLDSIPALGFAWFDPVRRSYATASIDRTPITIESPGPKHTEDSVREPVVDSGVRDFAIVAVLTVLGLWFGRALLTNRGRERAVSNPHVFDRSVREAVWTRLLARSSVVSIEVANEVAEVLEERLGLAAGACFSADVERRMIAAGLGEEAARVVARYFARVEEAAYSGAESVDEHDRDVFAAVVRIACD